VLRKSALHGSELTRTFEQVKTPLEVEYRPLILPPINNHKKARCLGNKLQERNPKSLLKKSRVEVIFQ
jgi:hypothetical protein